jgi:hypothetical protein
LWSCGAVKPFIQTPVRDNLSFAGSTLADEPFINAFMTSIDCSSTHFGMKGIYKNGFLHSNAFLSLPVLPLYAHISPLDSYFCFAPVFEQWQHTLSRDCPFLQPLYEDRAPLALSSDPLPITTAIRGRHTVLRHFPQLRIRPRKRSRPLPLRRTSSPIPAASHPDLRSYQPLCPVCETCQAPRPDWTPGQIGSTTALGLTTLALVVTGSLVGADMHTRRQQDRRNQSGSGTELANRSTFTTATPGPTPLQ